MKSLEEIQKALDLQTLQDKTPNLVQVLTELQGGKFNVVSGAAGETDIAVTGIATSDTLKAVFGIKKSVMEMAKIKVLVVSGALANTDIAVVGLAAADKILSIVGYDGDAVALADSVKDFTADLTVQAADNIQLGAASDAYRLVITYVDEPADPASVVDFTSTASVTSTGNIQSSSDTSDYRLFVAWMDAE